MRVNPFGGPKNRAASLFGKSPDHMRFTGHTMRDGANSLPLGYIIQPRGSKRIGEKSMKKIDRRSALKIGFAAASGAVIRPVAAQTTDPLAGKDTSPWPGVVVRTY